MGLSEFPNFDATMRLRLAAAVDRLAGEFARERLRAQAQSEGRLAKAQPEVLFVSLTGAGRAQIGAALLMQHAGSAVAPV